MRKIFLSCLMSVLVFTLFGCGGGSSSTPPTVSGTASQGSAFPSGSPVTVTDAKGVVAKAKVTGNSGAYSVSVNGMTAPFFLNVSSASGKLYSYASGAGDTNINPFTHLSVLSALGTSTVNSSTLTSVPSTFQTIFNSVVTQLKTALSSLYPSDIPVTQTDFLNGNISIGSGVDLVFVSTTITPPDSSGNFSITVGGQQIITGNTSSGNVTLTPNNSAISSAGNTLYPDITVSGQVTLNGVGLSGVSITLTGTGSSTVQTNSNGAFTFTHVQNGSYTLSAAMAGYTMSTSQPVTVNGANVSDVAFTATVITAPTYFISGQITLNGVGLGGVSVTLAGTGSSTAQTNSNGAFTFTYVQNGSYTLSASMTGYAMSASQPVTVNGANVSGITFTATVATSETLSPGTNLTMTANSTVLVPAGTTISSPNGSSVTVNGTNDTIYTQTGATVNVPLTATGPANNLVSTGQATSGGITTSPALVTVIAGSATTSGAPADGTGTAAIFWGGGYLALDSSGNIIATDRGLLRMVTQAGVVTTYKNVGLIQGFDGIAIDSNGNIFASGDNLTAPPVSFNGYIQELTTSGTVNTITASWESSPNNPSTGIGGLTVDSSGNLYLADWVNNRIVKFTSTGAMSVLAGSGSSGSQDGNGTSATFNSPTDLAIDPSGNLFVIDSLNSSIRKITPSGTVSTIAKLKYTSTPIAIDPLGNIYTVGFPSSIQRLDIEGNITSYSLSGISGYISALAADGKGNLYAGTHGVGAQILKISF
ncbi:MAG: carboxypeptidase-like regulatory domain-containing protein [Oryzomonas sp.]|uniref:carboxypeptidase regulatory-like domain-containing protein n=1 Tax=Oryzomonas sp. TaxID=2855186 RepID=UPI00284484B5|nr:carboxypeptidase regulatory-like domain-containing protein [Oryzomonas sp.]MDR3578575.1 carboxypeptidase-like regulatory domain-containing protein [Oryzomonas sp.]